MERRGYSLVVGSEHTPHTSMRHEHARRLQAAVHYAPPAPVVELWEGQARADGTWPQTLVEAHERKYGEAFQPALRARNAAYFAQLFLRHGVEHIHVHFANRAAHTALFLKEISGIPFSITVHGQDFMSDPGSEELLREICHAAEFVAVETDFSRSLLAERCPDAAAKIHRVYNGLELAHFPRTTAPSYSTEPARIVGVGRLVECKGFACLIEACAELKERGHNFTCEIIGDGPLRESLLSQIAAADLEANVTLTGALPQQAVFEKLRACDMFVLASTLDRSGRSDVFPTVILEAMASSRPVVATDIAGIPEAVVHGTTGLLVPSGNSSALAQALETVIRDQWLKHSMGNAGRERIEQQFQVETTIQPLIALLERLGVSENVAQSASALTPSSKSIAYLIDQWPDPQLPTLEEELLELQENKVALDVFVCEFSAEARLTPEMEEVAPRFVFLPDAIAVEAEWQLNRALGSELENDRANEPHRAPAAIFLRQARYAVALRPLLMSQNTSHLHATSSRALLCATMLKRLLGVTLSATIEAEPGLPLRKLRAALAECEGGRISDPRLKAHLGSSFLLEPAGAPHLLSGFGRAVRLDLKGHGRVWKQWSEMLERWR